MPPLSCRFVFPDMFDHALVSGTSAFKPKRHSVETERPIRGDKRRCGLVGLLHLNLMVSGVSVEETQGVVSCGHINNLVNAGRWERVFGASLIEVFEMYAKEP